MQGTQRIDIGTLLNRFDDTISEKDGKTKTFGIRFITKDGRIREMNARKNVQMPVRNGSPLAERGKLKYNLNFHGAMLLFDEDIQQYRSVKVAHIFGFRDFKSNQWIDVFH